MKREKGYYIFKTAQGIRLIKIVVDFIFIVVIFWAMVVLPVDLMVYMKKIFFEPVLTIIVGMIVIWLFTSFIYHAVKDPGRF